MAIADSIEWVSRDDLCDRLRSYVSDSLPEEPTYLCRGNDMRFRLPSVREQATYLLALLARPQDKERLTAIAADPAEAWVVRTSVFPHLLGLGGELPADCLCLDDDDVFFGLREGGRPAAQFLLLFRHSVPFQQIVEVFEWLGGGRVELLDNLAEEQFTPPEW